MWPPDRFNHMTRPNLVCATRERHVHGPLHSCSLGSNWRATRDEFRDGSLQLRRLVNFWLALPLGLVVFLLAVRTPGASVHGRPVANPRLMARSPAQQLSTGRGYSELQLGRVHIIVSQLSLQRSWSVRYPIPRVSFKCVSVYMPRHGGWGLAKEKTREKGPYQPTVTRHDNLLLVTLWHGLSFFSPMRSI